VVTNPPTEHPREIDGGQLELVQDVADEGRSEGREIRARVVERIRKTVAG
jgi:hypothetical protein